MRKFLFLAPIVSILFFAVPAFALSLDQAKQQGLVGEQPDGYLGARNDNPDVIALVSDINRKRKEQYQQIAKKNNTPVGAVEALAGEKAIAKTESGQYVRGKDGSWVKK